MIILPHIKGIPQETESIKVPNIYVASHSNASHIIYFETSEEYEIFKNEHFPKEEDNLKETIFSEIDIKTTEKIFEGFTFDGQVFSMNLSEQINLSNLFNIPEAAFPLPYSTKDNSVYSLSFANREAFYLAALVYKNTTIQEGNALKQQVKEAQTVEELQTILENL